MSYLVRLIQQMGRRHPERHVRLPIVEGLSLALDIDTVEEARAAGGDVAGVNERSG